MQTIKKALPFLGIFMLIGFIACQSGTKKQEYTYIEEGLDKLVKEKMTDKNYTILLADMDYKEADKKFFHKYQVVTLVDSTGSEMTTDWMEVSPVFFQEHENDLGMELASKTDGVLKKETAPPGYGQYVGNEKYGKWEERPNGGGSFWAFYGQYAFMSMMFRSMGSPSRGSYTNYNKNYRGTGKKYYGSGGSSYGTKATVASGKSTSSWAKKPSTFRDKVRTQVKQSSSQQQSLTNKNVKNSKTKSTTNKTGSSSKTQSSSKTNRNSSRYNSGSSSRSRGGGSGK